MRLLTIDEVADLLRVNKMTLYRLSKEGKIPAFKIGDSWRFEEDSLNKWMERKDDTTNWKSATVKAPPRTGDDPIGPVYIGERVSTDGNSPGHRNRKVGEGREGPDGRTYRWDGNSWRSDILPQRINPAREGRTKPPNK